MLKVEQSSEFIKHLKKYVKKHYDMEKLHQAVQALVKQDEQLLKTKYKDHSLNGQLQGLRELHIEGDWLLIYKIDHGKLILYLLDTGSHDDLF